MSIQTTIAKLMALGLPGALAQLFAGGSGGISIAIGTGEDLLKTTLDAQAAHAGGGQANGTLLSAMVTRFTTVTTAADSATLPTSVAGMSRTVANATATSMNVFPDVGGQINALGANTAFAVAAGKNVIFECTTALQWVAVLSA